ncbi:MAG: molybdate ABC transporter permease subunit [Reinekea sp.]|jgi:molybdate transport system permease protein
MLSHAIWLTVKLALTASVLLLLMCLPLASWLAATKSRLKPWVEAVSALPLVLPPTVLGFYLLLLMSPNSPLGELWHRLFDQSLAFSFWGLVIASMVYSFPFVVQPLQRTFEGQGRALSEAAMTIGANRWRTFIDIRLPLALPGLLAAFVLGFAHTVGEFGVVLMIGGNIPGQTQVLSIFLFDQVESLNYGLAHQISAGLVLTSLIILFALYRWNGRTAVHLG